MVEPIASRVVALNARSAAESAAAAREPRAGVAGAAAAPGRDAAAASVDIGGLTRALSSEAPTDLARVAALRAQIQAGRYPVDAGRIADAMIRSLKG